MKCSSLFAINYCIPKKYTPTDLVIVNIINKQKILRLDCHNLEQIALQILKIEKQKCDELSIYFVSTKKISTLHQQFFNDPSPTDCISFPLDDKSCDDEYRILGEVFVCPETAIKYAESKGRDPYDETLLYIIHGILHLIGYDDREKNDKMDMRKAERKHMLNLKKLCLHLKPTI